MGPRAKDRRRAKRAEQREARKERLVEKAVRQQSVLDESMKALNKIEELKGAEHLLTVALAHNCTPEARQVYHERRKEIRRQIHKRYVLRKRKS